MNAAAHADAGSASDGRTRRRERGRAAVIEGLIELLFEGIISPTADQIAERADVSTMSVYRYFDGVDDLRNAAIRLWFSRYPDILDIELIGTGDIADRIRRLIDARLTLYETAQPFGRLLRVRALEHQPARDMLALLQVAYTNQIIQHLDNEMDTLSPDEAGRLVAFVATSTSFEVWELLCHDHGFGHDDVHRSWTRSLTAVIGSFSPPGRTARPQSAG